MKNILITGASGFIGKNLVESLQLEFLIFNPTSHELDISDLGCLETYITSNKIEVIIHCATYNKRSINADIELYINLKMICNLEKASRYVEKVIYFGSGAEYDKRYAINFVKETEISNRIPDNAYGFSKYIANSIAKGSRNMYNLRLFGVFGKYEDYMECFISNLCCKALFDLPLSIRQNCMFDYLYIDDLCDIVKWFIKNEPIYHDYNIVSGSPISLADISKIVINLSGKDLEVKILKEGFNLPYTGDNSRLLNEVAFEFMDINIAINKLYLWYRSKKNNLDLLTLKNTR